MLLKELVLLEQAITRPSGFVHYDWNTEIEDEEGEGYIPKGYDHGKVLELKDIEVQEPGKGEGEKLMKDFLDTPEAKEAELIFLDPNPITGVNMNNKDEQGTVDKLVKFYSRFGFRHNPKSATRRMWLVRKGSIPDDQLPT